MKKFIVQVVLLVAITAFGFYLFKSGSQFPNLPFAPETSVSRQLRINDAVLKVEIADTPTKRNKGLAGRESLASDEGMLFVFPERAKRAFWMKGLTFPLDFIWIRGEEIVDLLHKVAPPASGQTDESLPIYQSREEVDKVLEVQAGTIQRLNIKVGDTIKLE